MGKDATIPNAAGFTPSHSSPTGLATNSVSSDTINTVTPFPKHLLGTAVLGVGCQHEQEGVSVLRELTVWGGGRVVPGHKTVPQEPH